MSSPPEPDMRKAFALRSHLHTKLTLKYETQLPAVVPLIIPPTMHPLTKLTWEEEDDLRGGASKAENSSKCFSLIHTLRYVVKVQPPLPLGLTTQAVFTVKQSLKGMLSMFLTST